MTTDDRVAALARVCIDSGITISLAGMIREADVARLLGVCARTTRNWRIDGIGPPAVRLGGRFWYPVDGLANFLSGKEVEQRGIVGSADGADVCEDGAEPETIPQRRSR